MDFLFTVLGLLCTAACCLAERVRPCAVNDYKCITDILAANSQCDQRVWGSVPEEITVINRNFQIPVTNMTCEDQYTVMRNINNCYVSEFFINPASDLAVLAISCPDITFSANMAISVRQPNNQNMYYSTRINYRLPLIHFTLNLRHLSELDLCNTFVFTYLTGPPQYQVMPNNELTREFFTNGENGFLTDIRVAEREEFLTRGPPIARIFINNMLCNFGCYL